MMLLARFLEFTVGNIVIIILSFFYGDNELGCFSMVMQFILLPIAIIGSAMGNVYYRELSDEFRCPGYYQRINKESE